MTNYPKTPLEQRLKQMLYEASHAEETDNPKPVQPVLPLPELTDAQCEAMDETHSFTNEPFNFNPLLFCTCGCNGRESR